MSLGKLAEWIAGLQASQPAEDWPIAEPIVADSRERIRRLVEIGLPNHRARHSITLGGRNRRIGRSISSML